MFKNSYSYSSAIHQLIIARRDVQLYEEAKKFEWDQFINLNNTIAVNAAVNSDFSIIATM